MKIETASEFVGILIAVTPDIDEQARPAIDAALALLARLSKAEIAMILDDVREQAGDE